MSVIRTPDQKSSEMESKHDAGQRIAEARGFGGAHMVYRTVTQDEQQRMALLNGASPVTPLEALDVSGPPAPRRA